MFSGGTHVGFAPNWEKSQVSPDGTIVVLRNRSNEGISLALAPSAEYREGFTVEGLDYVRGVRLVIVAA